MKTKQFRLFDAVLMAVVIVLVVESISPAAAIGPSQFFWWILLLIFFFVPYGLVSSELGTAYPSTGGLYTWVKAAFGARWGSRATWMYWISFPIWLSSLSILFAESLEHITSLKTSAPLNITVELIFIWAVVLIGNRPVSESKWLVNVAAMAKILIILILGCMGIYVAVTRGMATHITLHTLVPATNLNSLNKLSVIIFNFLGFEVVAGMSKQMKNPKKQIPQAIIFGGLLIAFFYLFSAFGVGAAIPSSQLSASSGLLDSIEMMVDHGSWIVIAVGGLFMFTLLLEMVSWSMGVNRVAVVAVADHAFPAIFGHQNKHGEAVGAGYLNGIVASCVSVGLLFVHDANAFNTIFTLNVVAILFGYLTMFPAFLKLRVSDAQHERPFRVRGSWPMIVGMAVIPEGLLAITMVLTLIPAHWTMSAVTNQLILWGGLAIFFVIGELIARGNWRQKTTSETRDVQVKPIAEKITVKTNLIIK